MDDDRIVISSGVSLTPDAVTNRTFTSAFRGYSPPEVRKFLKLVSDELEAAAQREEELRHSLHDLMNRAAHPEVDEAVLTTALGEHAARLLANARETAASITSDAEARAARTLRDAEERIMRMRSDVDGLLARRVEEIDNVAAGLRQSAEADARAVREQARVEAEARLEAARSEGREMVAEAKAVRERMLADLTRRRHTAQSQIDQLRAARERLLEAYAVVRRTLDEATQRLEASESEARQAAEAVARNAGPPPESAAPAQAQASPPAASAAAPVSTAAPASAAAAAPAARATPVFAPSSPPGADLPSATGGREPNGVPSQPAPAPVVAEPVPPAAPPAAAAAAERKPPSAGVEETPREGSDRDAGALGSPPPDPVAEARSWRIGPRAAAASQPPVPDVRPPGKRLTEERSAWVRERLARVGGPTTTDEPAPSPPSGSSATSPPAASPSPAQESETSPAVAKASRPNKAPPVADPTPPKEASDTASPMVVEALFARLREGRDRQASSPDKAPTPPPAPAETTLVKDAPPVNGSGKAVSVTTGTGDADTASGVAPGTPTARPKLAAASSTTSANERALERRDVSVEPVETALVRKLKRVLQDEQNEVLDNLRRRRQPSSESVVPEAQAQLDRYQAAAVVLLEQAAVAGTSFIGPGQAWGFDPQGWARELATDLTETLRHRLERALGEAGSDDTAVGEAVSAIYREWRVQQVEPLARHHAAAAFARGAFAAVDDGSPLQWVVDDEGGPCPDCDDNALAGATPKGDEFPTGQLHPPAHPGCRCLLVPAVP